MEFDEFRIVSTPQGARTVTNMSDIHDILVDNGLEEIANIVDANVQNRILGVEDELSKLQAEFASYEVQNEEYHDCIRDSAENINEVINSILSSKRLNKSELVKRLEQIFNDLWKEV